MRRRLLVPLIGLLAACSTQPVAQDTDDRAQLLARVEQFNRSIREGDRQGYADVFVDDFVFTWSRNGQIYDRETILPNVVPTPDHDPVADEFIVRTYGDSAVVNFRSRKDPGDAGVRVTFSYARVGGEWKVVSSHSTAIIPDPGASAE